MINVVIADDHTIVREGIKMILERVSEINVIAEAGNGLEVVSLVRKMKPEVVVMDVLMPEVDGIAATARIKNEYPETEIIALSMYADKHFISEMFKAGAKGFLLKDCASTELVEAIYTVRNGDVYIGPSISDIVAKMYVDNIHGSEGTAGDSGSDLSPREIEITKMLAEGFTNNEVAEKLHVSVKTVGTHRQNIMRKLGLRNIAELTKYAINKGLISLRN